MPYIGFDAQVGSNHSQVSFKVPYLVFNTQVGSNTTQVGFKNNHINFKMSQVYNNRQVHPLIQVNFYIQVNSYTQARFAQVGSYTYAQVGSQYNIYTLVDSYVQVSNQPDFSALGSTNIDKSGLFVQIGNITQTNFIKA
jgi:hypothetical protein